MGYIVWSIGVAMVVNHMHHIEYIILNTAEEWETRC